MKGGNASVTNYQLLNTVNQEGIKVVTIRPEGDMNVCIAWGADIHLIQNEMFCKVNGRFDLLVT